MAANLWKQENTVKEEMVSMIHFDFLRFSNIITYDVNLSV